MWVSCQPGLLSSCEGLAPIITGILKYSFHCGFWTSLSVKSSDSALLIVSLPSSCWILLILKTLGEESGEVWTRSLGCSAWLLCALCREGLCSCRESRNGQSRVLIVIIIRAGGGAGNQGNPLGAYDLVASTTSQLSLRQLGKDINTSGVIGPL